MFRKLKDAIDGALSALESRSGDAGDVDELLAGMRQELIEAKSALPRLEQGIERLRRSQAEERRRAEDCVRRAGQAKEIGDLETLKLAVEYGERHRERARVYGEKIEAAEAELAMQRRTVSEMTGQLKSAMTHRDVLKVRTRRSRSTEALRGGGDSAASRFDRMAEDIEDEAARAEAARELDDELGTGGAARFEDLSRGGASDLDAEALAELRLEELKRRMAEEG
jgi:phage shock protein A